MNNKKTITIGVIVIIAVGLMGIGIFSFFQDDQVPDTSRVRIAYLPVVQGLPLYLAIEKGYFEDAGIEIEAVKLDSPNLIIDALVSGQVDFGAPGTASGITAVADHAKPGELKIFALIGGDNDTTNDLLITKTNSGLTSIADLEGKKLGILPGIQFRTIAQHILSQNGLSAEEVTIVELAPALQVQALASGQVDAVLTIEPAGTIATVLGFGTELVHAPMVQFISDPWYGAVGVVRAQYAEENPEITAKVLDVFSRAIDEIRQDPEHAKQYLEGYTALDEQLAAEVPLPIFKMVRDFEESDIEALQKFFDIFTQYGVIGNRVDAQQLIFAGS